MAKLIVERTDDGTVYRRDDIKKGVGICLELKVGDTQHKDSYRFDIQSSANSSAIHSVQAMRTPIGNPPRDPIHLVNAKGLWSREGIRDYGKTYEEAKVIAYHEALEAGKHLILLNGGFPVSYLVDKTGRDIAVETQQ